MQISRGWRFIIILSASYAVILAAIIYGDLWKRHDSTNLLLHISVLTNFILLSGLLFWFGEGWKYFRLIAWLVYAIGSGSLAIDRLNSGSIISFSIWTFASIWGLYRLKEEIVMHMTINDTHEANNELLSGSKK
jgi:hypothetical protein